MNTHTNRRTPSVLSILTVVSLWTVMTVMTVMAPGLAFPQPTGRMPPTRWPVLTPFRAAA